MSDRRSSELAFGSFRLFPGERRLEKEGKPVRLGGRALDLLIALVERAGEIVPNRVLLENVWGDVNVEESSLRFQIKSLRKLLGDAPPDFHYVANVSGRGYCFVAPVERRDRLDLSISSGSTPGARANLPGPRSTVIGRADTMDIVSRELLQKRLVTISGPAGIGKTTLALAIAQALQGNFENSVFFVDLAPVKDPDLVVSRLASVLGVVLQADEPIPAVVDFLRDKRALILFDSCEQAIESVARLVDQIYRDATGVHMLTTSTETLQIEGERVHRLMPLECPPIREDITADEAMAYAAVQLFVERASANASHFALDDSFAPFAAEICCRLDGIPLAIELAAARVEFFGLPELAEHLNDMFTVLTQGRRFALPRHQTLRATLDWAYSLLSPTEQSVLRCIATFRAAFTWESALAVVVGPRIPLDDAVDAMTKLVAKSLLTAHDAGGVKQHRLLEPTRLYANEKLASSENRAEAARRHAEHHLKLIEDADVDWQSNFGEQWLWRYGGRIDDVRAALDWSFAKDGDISLGVRLTALSAPLWFALSLIHEYRDRAAFARTQLAAAFESGSEIEKELHLSLTAALFYANEPGPRVQEKAPRNLAATREIDDLASRLRAIWHLVGVKMVHGDYRGALELSDQFEKICSAEDAAAAAAGDRMKAFTLHLNGRHEEAETYARRALGRLVAPRSTYWDFCEGEIDNRVSSRSHLARILWVRGFSEQAAAMAEEGVAQAGALGYPPAVCFVLAYSACPIAFWTGKRDALSRYMAIFAEQFVASRLTYWEPWKRAYDHAAALDQKSSRPTPSDVAQPCLESSLGEMPLEDMMLADILGTLRMELARPEAIARAEREQCGWCGPELLRAKGAVLEQLQQTAEAEALFQRSIELARKQGALAWELRAATSLARLWRTQDRANEARDLLHQIRGRFVEGFDTADVLAATELLNRL